MKNKPISQTLFAVAIFIPLVLLISEGLEIGRIQKIGGVLSGLLIFLGILFSFFGQELEVYSKLEEYYSRSKIWIETYLYPTFVFIWPYIFFWELVIPTPFSKTIQNDFIPWYFTYKNYLIAHLSQFKIPLWAASEASGFPFYSSPLTQTFYFLNIPYAVFGRLRNGISILSYQVFTITGISIFALGLYFLLKEFKITKFSSLVVSFIIPISFKLIETARFPNAVHAAAWYPWILWILVKLSFTKTFKDALIKSLFLIFASINTITAGYPYFVYYLIFLVPPYLLIISIPQFRKQLFFDSRPIKWIIFLGSLLGSGITSLVLLYPYLREMQGLLGQTTNRAGKQLIWSSGRWSATFKDFVGSLLFPPAATSEGWIYFGIFCLLIILFFIISGLIRNNTRDLLFSRSLSIFILIWIIFIVYLSCDGNISPTNKLWVFLWNNLPGFSSLRVWARINIILLPIISILLGYSIQYFEHFLKNKDYLKKSLVEIVLMILIAVGILIYQYHNLAETNLSKYWEWIDGGNPYIFLSLSITSCLLFFGLIFSLMRTPSVKLSPVPLYLFLILFTIFDARGGRISNWIWIVDAKAKELTHTYKLDPDQIYSDGFESPRIQKGLPIPLNGEYNTLASRESWHYQRYVDFLNDTDNQSTARNQLLGINDGTRIFFTKDIDHVLIEDFIKDFNIYKNDVVIEVLEFSGDKIKIQIDTPYNGYLSYIDNWDPDWRVNLNGEQSTIELLFGTFKSVKIPAGNQIVEFSIPTI